MDMVFDPNRKRSRSNERDIGHVLWDGVSGPMTGGGAYLRASFLVYGSFLTAKEQ